MSPSKLGRYLSMTILSLAVVVLAALGGLPRQGPVSADSTSEAVRVGSLQDGVNAPRRPVVKITGWIREIAPAHLLIGDHALLVEAASRVAGDARVGLYAMATAKADDRGQLHARAVYLLPPPRKWQDLAALWAGDSAQPPSDTSGYPIEFRGIIAELDPRYWLVDGRMVLITDRTLIEGQPQLEALAEVKGMQLFQDTVLARTIKVSVPTAYAEVEFEGTIESLAESAWVVEGNLVRINPGTVIEGTPAVGAIAEVQGVLQPDEAVLAQRIIVTHPGMGLMSGLEGLVESIEPMQWVVAGTPVSIDSGTFIDDSRAPAEVGMWALVRGLSEPGGSLLAVRIRLVRPD
jgi:hypothetical protein